MRFKLRDPLELERAADYLAKLAGREATVDIKRVLPKRSLNQNSYLHLLLGYYGLETGYNLAEAKLIYKELNSDLYSYTKHGRTFYRSSANLTTSEMTKSIDRFRTWAGDNGVDLPAPDEQAFLEWIDNRIAQSGSYL